MADLEEVILSLQAIPGLSSAQQDALRRLGINRVSDLLHFRPVHDAQLIAALAAGRVVHDFEIGPLVDAEHAGRSAAELLSLPVVSLALVTPSIATELKDHFGVQTVEQLSAFEPFAKAQQLIAARANVFAEPPSAPTELMPTMLGAIQNSHTFSSFVNEKTLRLTGVELLYDEDRAHFIDERLAALFPVRGLGPIFAGGGFGPLGTGGGIGGGIRPRLRAGLARKLARIPTPEPELHLGYAVRFRQNWVNMGMFLGEVQHSLALAPGESRNIATIDWKRTHLTRRREQTAVNELLANDLVHTRALDEVARSVAFETQFGGTGIAGGTASSSAATVLGAAAVGGVAGAIPLAALGALAGGLLGTVGEPVAPGVANAIGAAAGAAGGAVIGFGLGAAIAGGSALVSTANAQLGVVRSDSTGARAILADLAQDITEATSQKSSSIRSLWSTVFVSDTQAESEKLQTRNVTNYNHSHALTIQYFEVLQHYRTEVELAAAEPLLFLPFRPLDFTLDLIADYWSILRTGIADVDTRRRYDGILGHFDATAGQFNLGDDDRLVEIVVRVQRVFSTFPLSGGLQPEVRLLGLSGAPRQSGEIARFTFADQEQQASQVTGVQVSRLFPGEPVVITATVRVEDQDSAERFHSRSSDRRNADDSGKVRFDFGVPGVAPPIEELQAWGEEIVRHFNARRYLFTRMLLLSLEREQLIDLVEALIFRRGFEGHINPPLLGVAPGVPAALPGFSARKLTMGAALGEAAGNRVRQVILGDVTNRQPGIPAASLAKIDASIGQLADTLRQGGAMPDRERDAAITAALAPLSATLKTERIADDSAVVARAKQVLTDLAGRLGTDTSLFEEAVPLTAFVDPNPFAITGNTLIFRMRKPSADIAGRKLVTDTPLRQAASFVDDLSGFVQKELDKRKAVVRNIFLPTSGVFAESVLGRANASEKLDVTRFFNWQDSPIPHLAPAIAQLAAGSRAQEPLNVALTVPGNVLNIVNPAGFPDPTGMAGILSAIQNGNIFRDMSKADQLVSVLGNLSQLAAKTAELAGNLAGQAQANALKAANDIANTVAQLAQSPTAQGLQENLPQPKVTEPIVTQPTVTQPTVTQPTVTQPTVTQPPPVLPRIRDVRIQFRVFVESDVWQVKPSLGTPPNLSDPLAIAGFLATLVSATPVDLFFVATRCSGQNRNFSLAGGESMAQVEITFRIDTQTMEATDFKGRETRQFASANFFLVSDTDDVNGKPEWFEVRKPGKTPIAAISGGTLPLTDQNFSVRPERLGQNPAVRINLDAAPYVPFTKQNVPGPDANFKIGPFTIPVKDAIAEIVNASLLDVNAEIRIMIEKRADGELKVLVSGEHDAFPSYELYVNGVEAYTFSPTSNNAPEDLRAIVGARKRISKEFPLERLQGEI